MGARRGGSNVDFQPCSDCAIHREGFAFTGDIASLGGPNGSHFLGSSNPGDDPNVVIGINSTGSHNIGRDIPLDPSSRRVDQSSGATYHVGVGAGEVQTQGQSPGATTFSGYAVGMVQSEVPANNFRKVVASQTPERFQDQLRSCHQFSLFADVIVRNAQNR